MVQNIHEIIHKYNLPLDRNGQPVYIYLQNYYEAYLKELQKIFEFGSKADFPDGFYEKMEKIHFSMLKKQCDLIVKILEMESYQGNERYMLLDELMRMLIAADAFRYLLCKKSDIMVRVRSGEESFERKDMLHIPSEKRAISPSQRFNQPGDVCLYMSFYPEMRLFADDMLEVTWRECGMPKQFWYSIFEVQEELYFLHLGKKGSTYLEEYDMTVTEEKKKDRLKAIEQYLLTFPLRAAICISIEDKINEKKTEYHEEYVFPQLLAQWLQGNSKFDGLTYQSSLKLPETKKSKSYNVVIPIKNLNVVSGYDAKIKKAFKVSLPVKVDFYDKLKVLEDKLKKVCQYAQELEIKLALHQGSQVHPYYSLLEICYSFESICSAMKNVTETHMVTLYRQVSALNHMTRLVSKTIRTVQTAEEWIDLYKSYSNDTVLTVNDYQDILLKFKVIEDAVFSLRGIISIDEIRKHIFSPPDYQFVE